MIFFLDENFPKEAVNLLQSRNHIVHDIRGTDKEGLADPEIFSIAIKNNAVFLTTDKDFFHTVRFLYEFHPGVIVISLSQPNSMNIIKRLTW